MSSLGSPNPCFIAGKKAYEVERSLRFDGDHSLAYLEETAGTPTNNKIWTYSVWIKRTKYTSDQAILVGFSNGGSFDQILFSASGGRDQNLFMQFNNSGTYGQFTSNQYFKDSNAWGHLVIKADTTAGTNGVTVYWNNQVVAGTWNVTLAQDATFHSLNQSGDKFRIGHLDSGVAGHYLNAYVAEANFIDGSALLPSSFGETNVLTGQWNPKKYTGSYGANGFYLNFSTNTLGTDRSGNGNNFTPNNFSVVAGVGNDALSDSPTNNFCVLNPIALIATGANIRNGGLDYISDSNYSIAIGNFSLKTGTWYWEVTITASLSGSNGQINGIVRGTHPNSNAYVSYDTNGNVFGIGYTYNGSIVGSSPDGSTNGASSASGLATYTQNDVLGFASDIANGTLAIYKNGTLQTTITGLNSHDWFPAVSGYGTSSTCSLNFGQREFAHTPPTGFEKLNSANLPDPTIAFPNKHFDILTWTGTAASHTLTGLNFQPDWFWAKSRSQAYHHTLIDSVRGVDRQVWSNRTNIEQTNASFLTSFNSNGLTLGDNSSGTGATNTNGHTYVGWNWNAGDTDGKTYTVTVVSDSGNKYRFDGFGTSAVTLDLAEGGTYIFNYPSAHPFRFSTTSDGTHGGGTEYTTGVTVLSSTSVQIVVAASAPQLYYFCTIHSGMGGAINTNSTLGSSNFDGSIQTRVKVNLTAGFSIISHTGTGAVGTIGHGLGVKPDAIFFKNRTQAHGWLVYHSSNGATKNLSLSNNAAMLTANNKFNDTEPTSSVITLKTAADSNQSGQNIISYCFSEVAGYSKFGEYIGNGNGNGTFVFTGFKVKWLLIKKTNTTEHWILADTKRNSMSGRESPADSYLLASASNAESTGIIYDLLSNGFKFRSTSQNTSGHRYVYFAFAEAPFKNARAR